MMEEEFNKPNKSYGKVYRYGIFALFFLLAVCVSAVLYLVIRFERSSDQDLAQSQETISDTINNIIEETVDSTEVKTEAIVVPLDYPTLNEPEVVTVGQSQASFLFGVPEGFVNDGTTPKKLIIALPGHGTTAKQGFSAWVSHLQTSEYGLAIVDWWNGTGETIEDYLRPEELVPAISQFLEQEGFTAKDLILLEGFSRGSANTYAVIANEKKLGYSLFDGIIANAGSYQSSFPVFANAPQPTIAEWDRYLKGTVWVLACGGKDPNPDRDGCPAMEKTGNFLRQHGAKVLALLTDPNQGHGAFHLSSLGLPAQALKLFEQALK